MEWHFGIAIHPFRLHHPTGGVICQLWDSGLHNVYDLQRRGAKLMNITLQKIIIPLLVFGFFHLSASFMVTFNGYTRVEAFVVTGFIFFASYLVSVTEFKK